MLMLSLGILAPMAASGAPEFVLDGRVGALEQLILAVDAEGPVTALDVLFYLDMAGYRAGALEVGHWLAEEGDRDPGAWERIQEGVEEYLAVRALARRSAAGTGADATSPCEHGAGKPLVAVVIRLGLGYGRMVQST